METKNYICKNCGRPALDWEGNPETSCPKCEYIDNNGNPQPLPKDKYVDSNGNLKTRKPHKKNYLLKFAWEREISAVDEEDAEDKYWRGLEEDNETIETVAAESLTITLAKNSKDLEYSKLLRDIKSFLKDYEDADEMSCADNINYLIDAVELLDRVVKYMKK